jgi:hypothetical protein
MPQSVGTAAPGASDDLPLFPPFQMNDQDVGWFLDLDLGTFAQDLETGAGLNGNVMW